MAENKPFSGSRFATGTAPGGFGARFHAEADGAITGTVTVQREKEGPPGHVHGGALATLLDEVMGNAAWHKAGMVLAVNLNINYKQPVPLDTPLTVRGWVERIDGRKLFTLGELSLPDGTVATTGTGLFLKVDYEALNLGSDDEWQEFGFYNED